MNISIRTNEPEFINPLMFRVTSDDGVVDKFAGVKDCTKTDDVIKLFKSLIEALEEIKQHEREALNAKTNENS